MKCAVFNLVWYYGVIISPTDPLAFLPTGFPAAYAAAAYGRGYTTAALQSHYYFPGRPLDGAVLGSK